MSETSRCREILTKFCVGYGVDVGYGGDPIVPSAITIDLPHPYAKVGGTPLNLGGDARNLCWFADNSLNYIYSSHLLEDFEPHKTKNMILEWLRVLAIGGNLILYLPDEQKYKKHCRKTGQDYNHSHKIENFNLGYIRGVLREISNIEIIYKKAACEDYSFEIVLRKTGPTERMNLSRERKEDEIDWLKKSLVDKDNRTRDLEQIIPHMRNTKGWRTLDKLRKARNKFGAFRR